MTSHHGSLRFRYRVATAILLLILALSGGAALWLVGKAFTDLESVAAHVWTELEPATHLQIAVLQAAMPPNDYLIHGDPAERHRFTRLGLEVEAAFSRALAAAAAMPEVWGLLQAAKVDWIQARSVAEGILARRDPVGDPDGSREMERLDAAVDRIVAILERVHHLAHDHIEADLRAARQSGRLLLGALAASALAVLAGVALGFQLLSRWIFRPLHALEQAAARLRDGDLAHRVNPGGGTETMRVAATFSAMAERLQSTLEHLRDSEERFRNAFAFSAIGKALLNRDGRYRRVNGALCRILGYDEEQLLAMRFSEHTHPGDLPAERTFWQELQHGQLRTYAIEKRYLHPTGREVWAHVTATAMGEAHGDPSDVLVEVQDISDQKRFQEQASHLWDHDPLTRLYNRRRFQQELDRHLALARRFGERGALLVLDLDNFKDVNDSAGNLAGDLALVNIANRLQEQLPDGDILARLGGDEFAILLPRSDLDRARATAEVILAALREPVVVGDRPFQIMVSAGISLFPEHGLSADGVLSAADLAMHQAKAAGGNSHVIYGPDQVRQAEVEARVIWSHRIQEALAADRFVLHSQPILDLQTGRISHHELLLRMVDPGGELIPPAAFLAIAEQTGQMREIDRWVVRNAIRLATTGSMGTGDGSDMVIEVNLSGRAFADEGLLPLIVHELNAAGLQPSCLVLEITETAAIANLQRARAFIGALKQLGCRFALDDFGTGYSSFAHLKYLPVDYLKIDGGFIRNLRSDPVDQSLVPAMVQVAHSLGKQVIAEFVGDAETLALLRSYGVDYAQGYHVGRPAPVGAR